MAFRNFPQFPVQQEITGNHGKLWEVNKKLREIPGKLKEIMGIYRKLQEIMRNYGKLQKIMGEVAENYWEPLGVLFCLCINAMWGLTSFC